MAAEAATAAAAKAAGPAAAAASPAATLGIYLRSGEDQQCRHCGAHPEQSGWLYHLNSPSW
jgi:hypothetical protein